MTDDLVQFVRDRLDEDVEAAGAATPGPWHAGGGSVYATHPTDEVVSYTQRSAAHIARHDPTRVLAEVEAKRGTLAQWQSAMERMDRAMCDNDHDAYRDARTEVKALTLVIRRDASVYAKHPDYREEWRPAAG